MLPKPAPHVFCDESRSANRSQITNQLVCFVKDRQCILSTTMGCPRTVYVFLLLSSYFVLAEAGRGRQALEEMKRRQTQARRSMEERVQRANRQRPNNGKPRQNKKPMEKVAAAAPPTTQPTDVLVDLRARLANLKRDIEAHARGA